MFLCGYIYVINCQLKMKTVKGKGQWLRIHLGSRPFLIIMALLVWSQTMIKAKETIDKS